MRKDTSEITAGILPEHQSTISQLASLHQSDAQMKKVQQDMEIMQNMTRQAIKVDDESFDKMVETILSFPSIEAIAALPDDVINSIFTSAEGEAIDFNGDKKIKQEEEIALRRDYIEFVFNSEKEMERLTEAQGELENIMKESDDEIREIYESIGGDITTYINNLMIQEGERLRALENPNEAEKSQLARIESVKAKLDEAVTLDSVIDYVEKYDARNLINDYLRKSEEIGTLYGKVAEKIKLQVNLTTFRNIERLFIKHEHLQKYDDLFTFIVMRYLAKKKDANVLDGVFVSQLAYELRCLYTTNPETANDEYKQRRNILLHNIATILEIVYTKIGK